jgi:hypothetical protein
MGAMFVSAILSLPAMAAHFLSLSAGNSARTGFLQNAQSKLTKEAI